MYQTMTIECLSQMIPFHDFSVVERISADAVKHGFVGMKVDHMKGVVCFGNLVSWSIIFFSNVFFDLFVLFDTL